MLVWIVRAASVLAFVVQIAFLWLTFGGPGDLFGIAFDCVLAAPWLIPLIVARANKPRLSSALLLGFILAGLGTVWCILGVLSATNSTAVLGLVLLPPLQLICFALTGLVGWLHGSAYGEN